MFNCDNGAIMRLTSNNTWSQYRDIPSSLWPAANFCGASMAGTATMLMLEPDAGYAAEVHHHHQITKLSHSINAIGPAPHRSC
jgi:hypothetical protein